VNVLKLIKPYSADSCASSVCVSYGGISLFFQGKFWQILSPKSKVKKIKCPNNVLKAYNLTQSQITNSDFWDGPNEKRVILSIISYFRFQDFLKRQNSNYFQAMAPAHYKSLDVAYWRQYEK
jgi:hypothetical protein